MVLGFVLSVPLAGVAHRGGVQLRRPLPRRVGSTRHARFRMTAVAPKPSVVLAPPAPAPAPPGPFEASAAIGAKKAAQPFSKTLLLGIVGGMYLSIGALLAMSVGGSSPALAAANPGMHRFLIGAIGLPAGLTLAITAGGDVFAGNTMLVTAAALVRRASWTQLARNWTAAYIGNLLGAFALVAAAVSAATVSPGAAASATALAKVKVGMPFGVAFVRGILCNWLVCSAIYVSAVQKDFLNKFIPILLGVSAFITLGYDQAVVNMFFIPFAMALGADITWKQFFVGNLLPVTLGNIVGGAILVAGIFHFAMKMKARSAKAKAIDAAAGR